MAEKCKTALCIMVLALSIWMACAQELAIQAGGQEGERSTYSAVAPAPWEVWNPLGR